MSWEWTSNDRTQHNNIKQYLIQTEFNILSKQNWKQTFSNFQTKKNFNINKRLNRN